jgi:pimeloyl-ACP methyl ester carboxylesterase
VDKATSSDGTSVAVESSGTGPPVVLVDGGFGRRGFGPNCTLGPLLSDSFTVFRYDRRGRGDSRDTAPFAAQREIEDLDAVIQRAGGSAFVYGISSGAAIVLEAARQGLHIRRLAVWEAPFIVDTS